MNTKIFLILGICCFALLTSCVQDIGPEGVSFDKEAFEENKAKWEKAGLKNYNFSFSFHGYRPDLYKGEVTVTNGVANANVYDDDNSYKEDNPPLPKDSKYYIEDIPMLFDKIYAEYERSLKRVEDGEYRYIEIQCEYDETYGYPVIIKNPGSGGSEGKKASMMGYRNADFDFKITDFIINTNE